MVVRYTGHQVADQAELLKQAAQDENGRVRLERIVAASWIGKEKGLPILAEAAKKPLDEWMVNAYEASLAHVNGKRVEEHKEKEEVAASPLKGRELDLYNRGKQIYAKEGYCVTCHQPDGKGLKASGFPRWPALIG